ncbi:hypothetical protein ElyMa_005239700 [Elysia marginata]|uniref:Endonuclease/exonuclease/phosphatase domain-containing protein n=1 Tax=Elysia marginata TaxID=1093978 RepID=A0AAV4JWG2_9GAST|nr:hypothetical protein ElyMa_005239700 [Elysia marginata]
MLLGSGAPSPTQRVAANKQLSLNAIDIPDTGCLILGDFNSHSQSWGYDEMDHRGEEVENWQIDQNLQLLNDPEDQDTFYSRRWRTSTPDLGFATDDIAKCTARTVQDQLAGSDHRPIMLTVDLNMKRSLTYISPRWNYKKANWSKFASRSDILTTRININTRRNYIPYWSEELQALHEEVTKARDNVEKEPSVDNNIRLKAKTARFKRESNTAVRNSWHKKTAQLNLEKDGQKLWRLVRSLNGESNRLSPIALEEENKVLTKRQAANHLVKQFSQVSDITVCNQRRHEVHQEIREKKRSHSNLQMKS